jgi:hypothetical protein
MVLNPIVNSRLFRLSRAVEALRERVGRSARARRRNARVLGDVVEVGSIVRVFVVDTVREVTLVLAPAGWSATTPGMVVADSALGAALVGGRVGETRRWGGPSGPKRLQIVDIVGRMPAATSAPSKEIPNLPVVSAAPAGEAGARQPRTVPLPKAA